MASKLVTFGKYKGKPIEYLQADTNYINWLENQAWWKERSEYKYLQNITVIRVGSCNEDQPTPEHNRMQVKWVMDQKFIQSVSRSISQNVVKSSQEPLFLADSSYARNTENLILNDSLCELKVKYDDKNIFLRNYLYPLERLMVIHRLLRKNAPLEGYQQEYYYNSRKKTRFVPYTQQPRDSIEELVSLFPSLQKYLPLEDLFASQTGHLSTSDAREVGKSCDQDGKFSSFDELISIREKWVQEMKIDLELINTWLESIRMRYRILRKDDLIEIKTEDRSWDITASLIISFDIEITVLNPEHPLFREITTRKFEDDLRARYRKEIKYSLLVELKPTIGEEYPRIKAKLNQRLEKEDRNNTSLLPLLIVGEWQAQTLPFEKAQDYFGKEILLFEEDSFEERDINEKKDVNGKEKKEEKNGNVVYQGNLLDDIGITISFDKDKRVLIVRLSTGIEREIPVDA